MWAIVSAAAVFVVAGLRPNPGLSEIVICFCRRSSAGCCRSFASACSGRCVGFSAAKALELVSE